MGQPLVRSHVFETATTRWNVVERDSHLFAPIGAGTRRWNAALERDSHLFEIFRSVGAHSAAADSVIPSPVPFVGAALADKCAVLPFGLQDYLDLVDARGRIFRADKRGAFAGEPPRLQQTLGLAQDEWFGTVTQTQSRFELFVGAPNRLKHIVQSRAQSSRLRRGRFEAT